MELKKWGMKSLGAQKEEVNEKRRNVRPKALPRTADPLGNAGENSIGGSQGS